ncbi:MAG: TetR family transcriptional regulator [Bacteroidales bacterium]
MELSKLTETKIVKAAELLFYQKGKAGTSMQDIADEAGITRTLLNYYFRSKDKLFEAVFRTAMERFVPALAEMLHSNMPFSEYLPGMIETMIDTLIENPHIPVFVLQELSSNPGRMAQIIKEMGINSEVAMEKLISNADFVNLPFDPRHAIMNVISLCIFPFASRPVVQEVIFGGDEEAYLQGMKDRKKILPEMILKFMNPSSLSSDYISGDKT